MQQELRLMPSPTVTMEDGRRGVQVTCAGALAVTPGTAWDDTDLVFTLLNEAGSVLAMERNRVRLEHSVDGHVPFSDYIRVPPGLAARVTALELWATGTVLDVTEIGRIDVPGELPAPLPGRRQFHTVGNITIERPASDEDGEVRLAARGMCSFRPGAVYDSSAELLLTMRDADGAVMHSERGRIETLGGQHGDAVFDDWFRMRSVQLERTQHMDLRVVAKRWISTRRIRLARQDFLEVPEDA